MMTAGIFKATLEWLRLSQAEAGRVLDLTDRTVRRYLSGELPIPRTVELALLFVQEHPQLLSQPTAPFVAASADASVRPDRFRGNPDGVPFVARNAVPLSELSAEQQARIDRSITEPPAARRDDEPASARKGSDVLERMKTIPVSRGR